MRERDYIKYYDLIAHKYAEEKFKRKLNKKRVESFLKYLNKKDKILDFGCGPGRDSKYFFQNGFEPIGIDFSAKMIAEAKKRVPKVEFVLDNLVKRKIKKHYFDGVWANSVFHHIPLGNFYRYFKKINRILKPGGIFYINMPIGADSTRVVSETWFGKDIKVIDSELEPENLQQMLEAVYFEVLEENHYDKNNKKWFWFICKKQEDIKTKVSQREYV